jgi:uncharacterized membrane protein YfcA
MITDPLFYLGAVPAVILMGLAKGGLSGLGLLSLPLMALVVSPVQAAAIMLPILMVQDVVTVWVYRHTWDRRNVLIILPAAVVGVLIGYLWAAEVSDAAVRLALGIISVSFALRRLVLERGSNEVAPTKADVPRGLFWGIVCGFTSMIAHGGGPPFQIYVMPQRLPQTIFVGTGAIVFALINWIKVPPYIALGQFSAGNLATAAALFPIAIAATYAGVWLVRRISGRRFYTIVYLLLILVGGKLLFDGASGLL